MLEFLRAYGGNVHSQNGEDLILRECLERLALRSGHSVEVGGNNGLWLSNTRNLIENGWSGLFIEADYDLYLQSKANWASNPRVRSQCCRVDERNINAFVDERCDLLSLDTDGSDYKIFSGLKAKPKIVIAEIDSSLDPGIMLFNEDGAANYLAMLWRGIQKGYFLLCHTGNMVFVDQQYKHLFPEITGDPLKDVDLYFNRAWMKEQAA